MVVVDLVGREPNIGDVVCSYIQFERLRSSIHLTGSIIEIVDEKMVKVKWLHSEISDIHAKSDLLILSGK